MKRAFIRFCGSFTAVLMGIFGRNTAYAACSVNIVSRPMLGAYSSKCVSGTLNDICKDNGYAFGTSSTWISTGTYSNKCWCRNVKYSSNANGIELTSGEIFCLYSGSSITTPISTCSGLTGNYTTTAISGYGGACNNADGVCYYTTSRKCATTYTNTTDAATALKSCCYKCSSLGVNQSVTYDCGGVIVSVSNGGYELVQTMEVECGVVSYISYGAAASGWNVTGDGATGSTSGCKIVASGAVTDYYGTYVAGDGGNYTCTP